MNEEQNIFNTLEALKQTENNTLGRPHSVPHEYFNTLVSEILNRVSKNDGIDFATAEEVVPILADTGVQPRPYAVPPAYFSDLTQKVLEKVGAEKKESPRFFNGGIRTMAIAASLIGLVAVISLLYIFSGKENAIKGDHNVPVATQHEIEELSTDQLTGFLNATDSILFKNDQSLNVNLMKKNIDFSKLLEQVPDKDLKLFLDDTGSEEDEFLLN